MSDPIRVFLVDDHELVRRGVAEMLASSGDIVVVGEAATVAQGRDRILATRPEVALLDVRLPDGSGIDLCRDLRTALPTVRCIMLTAYDDDEAMAAAILADASGYVLKNIRGSGLVSCVREVAAGHSTLDPALVEAARRRLRSNEASADDPRIASLNRRERQVLDRITDGLTNRQIAEDLSLSEKTVKNYVSGLLSKLDLQSRTQAAVFHIEHP